MPAFIMEFNYSVGDEVEVERHKGPFVVREIRIGNDAEEILYVVANEKGGRFHVFEEEMAPWNDNI